MFSRKETRQHLQPQDQLHAFPICVCACVFVGHNSVFYYGSEEWSDWTPRGCLVHPATCGKPKITGWNGTLAWFLTPLRKASSVLRPIFNNPQYQNRKHSLVSNLYPSADWCRLHSHLHALQVRTSSSVPPLRPYISLEHQLVPGSVSLD